MDIVSGHGKVFEGSLGKGEPVASCTRASFRGFLRREAIFIIVPRMEYSELYGNCLSRSGSEGFQFEGRCHRGLLPLHARHNKHSGSIDRRHLFLVQRTESSAFVVCLKSVLLVVCAVNSFIAVA